MTLLVIKGSAALSDFRQKKWMDILQNTEGGCNFLDAHFIYFAQLTAPLDLEQKTTLMSLLDGQDLAASEDALPEEGVAGATQSLITVPRIGTISPWSTKATDIVHHCGLHQVKRVERGIQWRIGGDAPSVDEWSEVLHDPMTESVLASIEEGEGLFDERAPESLEEIDLINGGLAALKEADARLGFALTDKEQHYLVEQFNQLGRNPTDVELMMFAQVNSEHCRHKIFNADWEIDGEVMPSTLFAMVRTTHQKTPQGTLTAYSDNAAVLEGGQGKRFAPIVEDKVYRFTNEAIHFSAKVETHNHPTGISPFPGAATGSGGEIRDEGATGRGGKPKAGLVGYSVSHLRIPDHEAPWEPAEARPERIASPLQIMLEAPIGAAAFNNEFGRPAITGYFRTFEQLRCESDPSFRYGYHKPIMLAGGLGTIREQHIEKQSIERGMPIIVLGGPMMLIGLGGGAASSVASGESAAELDFASVQRGNPEMQRRCQEVIDTCCAMGEKNPIVSIHDVGAGGVCNALPELVHDAHKGGAFELRAMLNDEPGMSPMQIWCNESQERYVMAIYPESLAEFEAICKRERCLYAIAGYATDEEELVLTDQFAPNTSDRQSSPIDLSMDVLFGLPPKMQRQAQRVPQPRKQLDLGGLTLEQAVDRVLAFPTVADKSFLITIGDRSVTGLIARDQMVGPWQVPVADVGVTVSGYEGYTGEAMAIGERSPIATIDAPASGRMAVGEALTNLAAASVVSIDRIKLSANWMVAAGEPGQDADLFETVRSVTQDICPAIGLAIPVGKDSMSMKTIWQDQGEEYKTVSPLSLIISAFAPVDEVRRTLTPQIRLDRGESELWLIDLSAGKQRLGASVLAQVTGQVGDDHPDLDDALSLKRFFELIQMLNKKGLLIAYHDRSDGGLMATLCEMAFAGRCGLSIDLGVLAGDDFAALFNEELGAVIQIAKRDRETVKALMAQCLLSECSHLVGEPLNEDIIHIARSGATVFDAPRSQLHRQWSKVSWQMQTLRDNPICAQQEYDRLLDNQDTGLFASLGFDANTRPKVHYAQVNTAQPKIAILREQGVNGQLEMAAAFHYAGFEAVDVTMSDLIAGKTLSEFTGFAACGGFSFGDVLGAGQGWAKSILFNPALRDIFAEFFVRQDTFALGVCNGCQMMASIKSLIPGADHWLSPQRNLSEQYEARSVMVKVTSDQSILFDGMQGSMLPVSIAHGEGRMQFDSSDNPMHANDQIALQFVDSRGDITQTYPMNPNGSEQGITGMTSDDGRFTIMMPHPERVLRTIAHSWSPDDWGEYSPWSRMFDNARAWVN